MHICLFGGTGYVGSHLMQTLVHSGCKITILVRNAGHIKRIRNVEVIQGNILDRYAVDRAVQGSDAVVYSIGVLREYYKHTCLSFEEAHVTGVRNAVKAAEKSGTSRFILLSALGARPDGTAYQDSKYRGEEIVLNSNLDGVILRPSLIYGGTGEKIDFSRQILKELILPFRPIPLFFSGLSIQKAGTSLFTPVHIDDLLSIILESLDSERMTGQTVTVCGKRSYSWKELIAIIGASVQRRKIFFPLPSWLLFIPCLLLEKFTWFPVSRGQIRMVLEGNAGAPNLEEFGIKDPDKEFTVEELAYLNS